MGVFGLVLFILAGVTNLTILVHLSKHDPKGLNNWRPRFDRLFHDSLTPEGQRQLVVLRPLFFLLLGIQILCLGMLLSR